MTLGLTVVTHFDGTSGRDIRRCVESVADALPENSNHLVIDLGKVTPKELYTARHGAIHLNDIVIFVDDDDFISKDSLQLCVDALSATNAGLAFTREIIVRPDNSYLYNSKVPTSTMDVCNSPTVIHHMSAFRTKYITERSRELSLRTSVEMLWIMKADAIANAGAIFIPIDGYYWVQHSNQLHRQPNLITNHRLNYKTVTSEMRSWYINNTNIPVWEL